jgi:hypothetical protein
MNIDREFVKWFYEAEYPEQGSNRRQVYSTTQNSQNINVIDYWMREAFKAGAEAATHGYEVNALEQFEAFNINRNYPL